MIVAPAVMIVAPADMIVARADKYKGLCYERDALAIFMSLRDTNVAPFPDSSPFARLSSRVFQIQVASCDDRHASGRNKSLPDIIVAPWPDSCPFLTGSSHARQI